MKCFEYEQLLSLLWIGGVHPEGNDGGMLGSRLRGPSDGRVCRGENPGYDGSVGSRQ